jgi:hypothetical protein
LAEVRRGLAALVALCLAGSALGCARLAPWLPPAFRPCRDAALESPASLGPDFRWRAQVSLRSAGEERAALDLVVEKQGEHLALVAFDRAGMRALSAEQEGRTLRTDPAASRRRPVAAETLLADLRRLRLPASVEPDITIDRSPAADGAAQARISDPRCGTQSLYRTLEERPLP